MTVIGDGPGLTTPPLVGTTVATGVVLTAMVGAAVTVGAGVGVDSRSGFKGGCAGRLLLAVAIVTAGL